MVTGTHDVRIARQLIVHAALNEIGYALDPADDYGVWAREGERRREIAHLSHGFSARLASLETGRIIPNGAGPYEDGYAWFWHRDYGLGKPGVTRAVVWR